MVCGLVKLLQFGQLSIPIEEGRSPYAATIKIEAGVSTKEETASVSKTGQQGSTS